MSAASLTILGKTCPRRFNIGDFHYTRDHNLPSSIQSVYLSKSVNSFHIAIRWSILDMEAALRE